MWVIGLILISFRIFSFSFDDENAIGGGHTENIGCFGRVDVAFLFIEEQRVGIDRNVIYQCMQNVRVFG